MKRSMLMILFASSLFGETPEFYALERQVSHILLVLPGHSVFDSIDFRLDHKHQVTLDGQVTLQSLKEEAQAEVEKIHGVTKVMNNLRVLPVSEKDDEIRNLVLHALHSEPALQVYRGQAVWPIHVVVERGFVTLVGVVNSDSDKVRAGVAANTVQSAAVVINNLKVAASHNATAKQVSN